MAARELVREVVFDTKGKGYVAANTIDRGVIVLEEKPFAFAVHDGMVEKVCHECLVRSQKLYRCSKCEFARYCGKQCQKQAWEIHKSECTRLQTNSGPEYNETIRLLGRMIDKLEALKANNEANPIGDLLSNPNETLRPELGDVIRSNTYLFTRKFLGCDLDIELFDQLVGQNRRNGFGLRDDAFAEGAAIALFPKFALFNHSCCPNVAVFNVGMSIRARAIRRIRQGEELTLNYVEDLMLEPIEYRKERLRVRYLFDCTCPACTSPEAIEKNKIHTRLRVERPGINVRQCVEECTNIDKIADALQKANFNVAALAILDKFIEMSPLDRRSCYIRKLASLAQACCFALDMWKRTLEFGDIVTESIKTFVSSDSMFLAEQYVALCASLLPLERHVDAALLTQKALDAFEAVLGKDHPATMRYEQNKRYCLFNSAEYQEASRRGDTICFFDLN